MTATCCPFLPLGIFGVLVAGFAACAAISVRDIQPTSALRRKHPLYLMENRRNAGNVFLRRCFPPDLPVCAVVPQAVVGRGTLRNSQYSFPARFEAPASCRRNRFYPFLSSCRHLAGLGRHHAIEFCVLRETVNKGQNHVAVEDKPLARVGMGYIGHLLL